MNEPAGGPAKIAEHEKVLAQADTSVASFEHGPPSVIAKFRHFLHVNPTAIPAIVLVLSILIFGVVAGERFFKMSVLSLILQQVTVVGLIAIAQTIIILTAGIDLSVGAITVVCTIIMGKLSVEAGLPPLLAILIALGAGGVMGFLNAWLITYIELPPFIATLGTWNIFDALKIWYSGSESIRAADIEATAPTLIWFGNAFDVLGAQVTYGGIALILLAALFWYVLNWTAWGRHVHAIGDDPEAAELAGIQTKKNLISVYVVAGLLCAFAAWVLVGRVGSISPQAIATANLDSITAVVIGGTSLFGGRGSIIGSVLGALIVGVFNTGLSIAGQDELWKSFTVGVLIIVAVALDQWLRRATK
jgi:fructose transport system permease protein